MILEEVDDDDNKGVVSIVFSPNGESPNMVNAQIVCKTKRERFKSIDFSRRSRVRERARFALAQFFLFFSRTFFFTRVLRGELVLETLKFVSLLKKNKMTRSQEEEEEEEEFVCARE